MFLVKGGEDLRLDQRIEQVSLLCWLCTLLCEGVDQCRTGRYTALGHQRRSHAALRADEHDPRAGPGLRAAWPHRAVRTALYHVLLFALECAVLSRIIQCARCMRTPRLTD
jgi:hypothetical protein